MDGSLSKVKQVESKKGSLLGSLLMFLLPLEKGERKKVVLLSLFKFIASFVFVVLTSIKEPLVVLAPGSGAEVIPVIKSIGVLPLSIAFAFLYGWLSNRYHPTKIFFWVIGLFFAFFLFYIYYLYPNAEALSPRAAVRLLALYPKQRHWIAVYRYWMHAVSFAVIELYGQVMLFMVFWGVANEICSRRAADRLYHIFIMYGVLGGFVGTRLILYYLYKYPVEGDYGLVVGGLVRWAIGGIAVLFLLYWWMYCSLFPEELRERGEGGEEGGLSFWEGVRYVFTHPYLRAIAVLVLCYGVTINLVDVSYKSYLKKLYPDKVSYQLFSTQVLAVLLLASAATTLLMSGPVLRLFGWKVSAYVTPCVVFGSGAIFFCTSKFRAYLGFIPDKLGVGVLPFIIWLGVVQGFLSKLAKYAFFDSTKEVLFIGLDKTARRRGKAAIDLIGSRVGKSLSSYLHSLALYLGGTAEVVDLSLVLLFFLCLFTLPWLWAVRFLGEKTRGATSRG